MLKFMRNKMKAILITIAVVFAGSMFYGLGSIGLQGGFGLKSDDGLATVNGREVDKFRFNQIINNLLAGSEGKVDPLTLFYVQSAALAQLIEFEIIEREAEKHFRASDEEINRAVNDIMNANKIPNIKAFNDLLKSQGGFSVNDLKNTIKGEIVSQRMKSKIIGDVTITPDDLREISVQHILISTVGPKAKTPKKAEKLAQEILDKLKNGGDFAVLAEKYSDDIGSATNGGNLGFFNKNSKVKEFSDAAFALKPGEMSGIVKTDLGYDIIKMKESRTIRDVKKDEQLKEKQDSVFKQWFFDIKSKAKIEIKNHLFKAFDHQLKGNIASAAEEYEKAIEAHPANVYPRIFYADFLGSAGSPEAAEIQYTKASEIAGPDPYAHVYIGKALLKSEKISNGKAPDTFIEKAKQEFVKASILAGENKQVREELARQFELLKLNDLLAQENAKIKKLETKEKFEEEIRNKTSAATMESPGR